MFEPIEIGNPSGTWTVVASVHTGDGTLFLGERYRETPGVGIGYCLAYVVAFARLTSAHGDYEPEWHDAQYFDGDRTQHNRNGAYTHFLDRAREALHS